MRASQLFHAVLSLLACIGVSESALASLKPQGPTSIVTQVYRNPLTEPVLGTRAYLPYAWLAATGRQVANPRGIAPGREQAGSDTFDVGTSENTVQFSLSEGVLAPGAFDAFRVQTRGYFFVDYATWQLETASGTTVLDDHDPNVLTNILAQTFRPDRALPRQPAAYILRPQLPFGGGGYEFELEDIEVYFGLPLARFALDTFLEDLPAPDYAQALLTLPADAHEGIELVASDRYSNSSYALATIGRVRARNVETGEVIDYGSVAFAQTPRGIDEPGTLALLVVAGAALAARISARSGAAGRSNPA